MHSSEMVSSFALCVKPTTMETDIVISWYMEQCMAL